MRLPRMGTRSLIVLVTVASLLVAGRMMGLRSISFRREAAMHAAAEDDCTQLLDAFGDVPEENLEAEKKLMRDARPTSDPFLDPEWLEDVSRLRRETLKIRESMRVWALQRDHHARLRRRYERAADRPWTVLPPDPAEPTSRLFEETLPGSAARMTR
jgi:hypothetical protein